MNRVNLVLLGDQTVEKLSSIQALVHRSKTSTACRKFLQSATDLVILGLCRLNHDERQWNHDFTSLLEIAENNAAEQHPNKVLATVLMCIGRLGELIAYAEQDSSVLGSDASSLHVLAYCTGLLPAAALVAATSVDHLCQLGLEIVAITFRLSLKVTHRMRLIENSLEDWAVTLVGKADEEMQSVLDRFHTEQNIPYPKRIAIGVVSKRWFTLFGPPSSLSCLLERSDDLRDFPRIKTISDGLVHTNYVPRLDIDVILGNSPLLQTPISSKAKMMSPATCKPYIHANLHSLLAEILVDIAHNVLRLYDVTETCISDLLGKGSVSLFVAGPTIHLPEVQRLLKDKGVDYHIKKSGVPEIHETSRDGSESIAIIGMAGRFPGSETLEGFWDNLISGKVQIKKVPKSRFDIDEAYDPEEKRKNSTSAQHGAFLDNPGHFDNRLFNISPREAVQMDPLQRLLLTTSYEALQMAGYSKDRTAAMRSNRISTYFGQVSENWSECLNNEGIDMYYVPAISRAFTPGRVHYHYKFGGGSYALDAACSTSTTGISLACSALLARECDTALVGGGSILTTPNAFAGLSRAGMLSKNGGCRAYHHDADGYARAESIGVVVLKRLEDATLDNDNILGVIRGWGKCYSTTSLSITRPSAESQARIYRNVLRRAQVQPSEVSYVEMHGTGTKAGDLEEMTSVLSVMGHKRTKDNVLTVGTVRANVGHSEGGAGMVSLIKILMMFKEQTIPSQPNVPFQLNPNFPDLEKLNVRICQHNTDLSASSVVKNGKFKAMINGFDASGGNTSILVEEPPQPKEKVENPLPYHVVVTSAKTVGSLQANRERLLTHLMENEKLRLSDVAYTTTARRIHESLRLAVTGQSVKEIIEKLETINMAEYSFNTGNEAQSKPVIFMFSGQGSQYAGMGSQLFQNNSTFRSLLCSYQELAEMQGFSPFLHLITNDSHDISDTSLASKHLALVSLQIATATLLTSWGVRPNIVLGHSLGELSALCVAGVLSISDTLMLVGQRAQLMEEHLHSGEFAMAIIDQNVEAVKQYLLSVDAQQKKIDIACINAPKATVLSGPKDEIENLRKAVSEKGWGITLLKLPYGFHSPQMDMVLSDLEGIAKTVVFSKPSFPVASSALGYIVNTDNASDFNAKYIVSQTRGCVDFVGALESCKTAGFVNSQTSWLEIGPEMNCSKMAHQTLKTSRDRLLGLFSSSKNDWQNISSCLATLYESDVDIQWSEYYKDFSNSLSLITLPTYAFENRNFWTTWVDLSSTVTPPLIVEDEPLAQDLLVSDPVKSQADIVPSTREVKTEPNTQAFEFIVDVADYFPMDFTEHMYDNILDAPLHIYSAMAKLGAERALLKHHPNQIMSNTKITNMNLRQSPQLARHGLGNTRLKTTVSHISARNTSQIAFYSIDAEDSHHLGDCQVAFQSGLSLSSQDWQISFLVQERIQSLKRMATEGIAHRLLKPVFQGLLHHGSSRSQNILDVQEVWADIRYCDAVARIVLADTRKEHLAPHSAQICSVSLLIELLVDSALVVAEHPVVITGYEKLHNLEELQAGNSYMTYVSVQKTEKASEISALACIYRDDKLIQVITGITVVKVKANPTTQPKKFDDFSVEQNYSAKHQPQNNIDQKYQTMTTKAVGAPEAATTDDSHKLSGQLTPSQTDSRISSAPATDEINTDDESAEFDTAGVGQHLVDALLSIVTEETGHSVAEMNASTSFADVGVDSLMCTTIIASFKRKTTIALSIAFFAMNPTIGEATKALENWELHP